MGEMYALLKQLGLRDYAVPNSKTTKVAAEKLTGHFERVQEKRDENPLSERIQARKLVRQFVKQTKEGKEDAKKLNEKPTEAEIKEQWQKVKEKSPGEDRYCHTPV